MKLKFFTLFFAAAALTQAALTAKPAPAPSSIEMGPTLLAAAPVAAPADTMVSSPPATPTPAPIPAANLPSDVPATASAINTNFSDVATNVPVLVTNMFATTAAQREITLSECIEGAFRHNLDLQIERYNPQLSVFSLNVAYGAYDPTFSMQAEHTHNESAGTFVGSNGIPIFFGQLANGNNINGDLAGVLPWGTTYDFSGTAVESYGSSGVDDTSYDHANGQVVANIDQPLLRNFWMNDTRLAVQVGKNRVKYSDQGLRQQLINIVSDVELAYYELIFAQEEVKVQEKALQLAQQLFQENSKRVEVGVLAPLDEKQAESQMATSRATLIDAQREVETRQNNLKTLISDDYASLHDISLLPNEPLLAMKQFFNLRDSWGRGLNERPDLLQTKLDLEQAGIQLKYYRNQVFPQLDAFGSYGYGAGGGNTVEFNDVFRDITDRNQPSYSYGLKFSIPLGNVAARNRYKSGKATVQQAVLTLKKTEQNVMVQIDEAIKQAKSAFEKVTATREAREFAEAALEAEQKKLENGKSTSFQVLSLQSQLTTAASAEIRALADYNESLTTLAQQEGSTLERRKIDIRTD